VILADTSLWVDHLRGGDATLRRLLDASEVLAHPFVIGDLALGALRQRRAVVEALRDLPQAAVAEPDELLTFIDAHALSGTGIGYEDASLLAATKLTPGALLWTRDKRLLSASDRLGLAARLES
jgi:predicted nucleic acid-binding protein